MFKKLVILLTVLALVSTGCGASPQTIANEPATQPAAPEPQSEATIVPAGSEIVTEEGNVITTPTPVRVATPPVLQEEVDGLQVYYLYEPIDWQEAGLAVMPIGAAIAMADTPMPGPADILGFIVVSTVVIGCVVYTANVPVGAIYYEDPGDLSAILALWATILAAYIPVTPEHKLEHSVVAGSANEATQVMQDLAGRWPPNPNETDPVRKVLCYVLTYGDEVLRYLVWAGTGLSGTGLPRGNLSWWQYGPSGPEAYGYTGKSLRTMENVPQDLQGKGYNISPSSCDNFTPPFQLLAP